MSGRQHVDWQYAGGEQMTEMGGFAGQGEGGVQDVSGFFGFGLGGLKLHERPTTAGKTRPEPTREEVSLVVDVHTPTVVAEGQVRVSGWVSE